MNSITSRARRLLRRMALWAFASLVTVALVAPAIAPAGARAGAPPRFVGLQAMDMPTATQLRRIQGARVTEFRRMVTWRSVEPERPLCTGKPSCHRYVWRRYDRLFDAAARRNIRVLPYLLGSPEWVRRREHYPPETTFERRAFNDFVKAFTRRYGPHGSFWHNPDGTPKPWYPSSARARFLQIWNEPNLGQYWNHDPRPAQYARLLTGASTAAKVADPDIRVVSAGLPWGKWITPEDFLRGMYAWNGGAVASKIDAVAIHVYKTYPGQIPSALRSARSTLHRISRTAGSRPMWVTEMGWATGPYDGRYQVSDKRQAANLKETYDWLIAHKDDSRYNIDRAMWFSLADTPGGADKPGGGWWYRTGLFRQDGVTAKPSWSAFKQVTGAAG